jgi:hypothetical protein
VPTARPEGRGERDCSASRQYKKAGWKLKERATAWKEDKKALRIDSAKPQILIDNESLLLLGLDDADNKKIRILPFQSFK